MKLNHRCVFSLIGVFFFMYTGYGQTKLQNANSYEDIKKGVDYHDAEEYAKAIRQYEKIYRCDTNYLLALYEKSYSLFSLKKYEEAIKVCNEATLLDLNGSKLSNNLLLNKANSLDELGKSEESLLIYDELILKYPMNYLYAYNKAVVCKKLKRDQEAVDLGLKVLELNPYHSASYLMLAQYAKDEGKFTIAMICYSMYLHFKTGTDNSEIAIVELQKMLTATQDLNEKKLKFGKNEDDFSNTDEGIENFAGLNNNYKAKGAFIKTEFVKAETWVLTNLKSSTNPGLFGKYYVPYFKKIITAKKTDDLFSIMLLSSQNYELKSKAEKRRAKIDKFILWSKFYIEHEMLKRKILIPGGKEIQMLQILGSSSQIGNRTIFAHGNMLNEKKSGYWIYYHNNSLIEAEGLYDANERQQGLWKYYHENGKISFERIVKNNINDGEFTLYNEMGVKTVEGHFCMGKRCGTWNYYFENGFLREILVYDADKLNGKNAIYYAVGGLKSELKFKDGKLQGEGKLYYPNGKLKLHSGYKDGKLHGEVQEFYSNGVLKTAQNKFADGKLNGERIAYFKNGNIESKGTFKNGLAVGKHHLFREDGVIELENMYDDNGKLHGKSLSYNHTGKVILETGYDRGDIDYYKFYNNEGVVLHEAEVKKKKLPVKAFYPDGMPSAEGQFIKGEKEGIWKKFNRNGILQEEINYVAGQEHGIQKTFYLCGAVKSESKYTAGVPDGYWVEYFPSGKISEQGYYENGNRIGMWKSYYFNGNNKATHFYKDGGNVGVYSTYKPWGKTNKEWIYNMDGEELYSLAYDTAGKVFDTLRLVKGNGMVIEKNTDGKSIHKTTFVNWKKHGPTEIYFPSGQLKLSGYYYNDDADSVWTWYQYNGKIISQGIYEEDNKVGVWKSFHENGKLSSEVTYNAFGKKTGPEKEYNEEGKLIEESNYYNGELHGERKLYHYFSGQLEHIRYYEYGKFISYAYLGEDGKLTDKIKLENETGNVVAYYANGTKSRELNLKKGVFEGPYKIYHPNGKVYLEYNLVCDESEGIKTLYYENGQVYKEIPTVNGMIHGKYKEYYSNGKLKIEADYIYDDLYGMSKYYNSKGKVETEIYFEEDLPVYQSE